MTQVFFFSKTFVFGIVLQFLFDKNIESKTYPINARDLGILAGKTHDIGKYSKEFQNRIKNNGPKVDLSLNTPVLPAFLNSEQTLGHVFFLRMLYSCLVDADFLDTANFMLNEPYLDTDCLPYCLGRLFAVLEKIQSGANPGLNSTIMDKYFNSASATPAVIFPPLMNLSENHLKKLRRDKPGYAVNLEKERNEIVSKLPISYPARMTLAEQGSFQLGYYHQNIALYTKKQEDTENG